MAASLTISPASSFTCRTAITPPTVPFRIHKLFVKMSERNIAATSSALTSFDTSSNRKLPVLLFDVMDTLVRDPFYHDIPSFFRMSMKELLDCKHPTSWIEFEKGLIDESELARRFFKDGRSFDLEGLKSCMKNGYSYLEGVEELLHALKINGYEIHAFTNYPIWYLMIEEKLKLSTYLSWTFCSCHYGKRKPEVEFYQEVRKKLHVEPENCVFIDDRMKNVEAAIGAGFKGVQFKGVDLLRKELLDLGIHLSTNVIGDQVFDDENKVKGLKVFDDEKNVKVI